MQAIPAAQCPLTGHGESAPFTPTPFVQDATTEAARYDRSSAHTLRSPHAPPEETTSEQVRGLAHGCGSSLRLATAACGPEVGAAGHALPTMPAQPGGCSRGVTTRHDQYACTLRNDTLSVIRVTSIDTSSGRRGTRRKRCTSTCVLASARAPLACNHHEAATGWRRPPCSAQPAQSRPIFRGRRHREHRDRGRGPGSPPSRANRTPRAGCRRLPRPGATTQPATGRERPLATPDRPGASTAEGPRTPPYPRNRRLDHHFG